MKPTAKLGSLMLAALMVVGLLLPAPIAQAATDYSVIGVNLTSMGVPSSVNFKVNGAYQIAEATGVSLVSGVTYTISVTASGLQLQYDAGTGATTVPLPASVTFKQYANGTSSYNSLYVINNAKYGSLYYTGDMTFKRSTAASGTVYVQLINSLYIETYLYGVIRYEMSSGWPVEALKAQAVCARTYAMRYIKRGSYITDESNNQVYRGLGADGVVPNSISTAVNGTKGQVIVTGDPAAMNLVDGEYSASNGGQIYTQKICYGADATDTYHVFKNDPYDLANPSSPTFTYVIPANGDGETFTGTAYDSTTNRDKAALFLSLLKDKLVADLAGQGIAVAKEAVTVNAIKSAVPAARRDYMPDGCNAYTQIAVTCTVTATAPSPTDGSAQVVFQGDRSVSLIYLIRGAGGVNDSTNTIYSAKGELKTAFANFSTLINTNSMWLLYAEPTSDGRFLNVVARGYGHGRGLSQRGAQQMANLGKLYTEILTFYYNIDAGKASVNTVAVSQPALTQMPGRGDDRTLYGTVNVSSGNLNLRASPSTSATIVASMPKGAQVQILGTSGVWYQVRYVAKNLTGYVQQSYIKLTEAAATPTPTPAPTARASVANGTVSASLPNGTDKLVIRSAAADSAAQVGTVDAAEAVVIYNLTPASGWYEIGYNDISGFVPSQYITLDAQPTATVAPTVAPTAAPDYRAKTVTAGLSAATSLRAKASSSGKVVTKIPKGATVTVLSVPSASWLQVKYNSYTGYLPATACYVGGSGKYRAGVILSAPQGLYRTAGDLTSLLAMIPVNTTVQAVGTVKAGGRTWYKVALNSGYAFVYAPKVRLGNSKSALATVSASSTTTSSSSPAPTSTSTAAAGTGDLAAKPNVSSYLTLRSSASTSGASLARIPKGATMTIKAVVNATWLQVSYDGKTGYVQSKYALINGKSAYKACQVTTSSLLVRSAAGSSTSIGSLANGAVVCVTGKTTKSGVVWYKILYGSRTGYISSKYCRLAS